MTMMCEKKDKDIELISMLPVPNSLFIAIDYHKEK